MQWRQGDVLFQKEKELPKDVRPRKSKVLYEGEATGHLHRVDEGSQVGVFELGNFLYLKIDSESATIVHDEHGPITLEAGIYKVWQQREYRPGGEARVGD